MKGGLLMELKHYPQLTVEKITGEHTKFYPYKLNWIISQLPLNQDQKDTIIQDLTNYFNNYQDDLIPTANIYNQLINVLTNHNYYKAKEQVKKYHQKIQHEFKQATNPVHKIDQLREGDKNITNENANKDSRVYSTQRDLLAGSASRAIGLSMLPPLVAKAHQRGDIHWHDLDYSPFTTETNCCLPNFRDMLQNGFKLGNAWVSSPKSIEVAVTLISEIITSIAGSQYGGQSCNRLDEVLAPYAKLNYDKHLKEAEDWVEPDKQENFAKKRTIHDITNAMQSLEYNINMMMSTQGQTPFVTVNFGLGTSWIEREIQKAILNVRIKGLGRERRTAGFPKLVFTLKKGINLNPSDPNYDIKQLAIKCSTRRIYPDILNYDNIVKITGSFKSPMGCRSFLQGWINPETGKDEEDGRMNLGVVTVNLPRIALEAHGDQDLFWEIFNERMAICHQALKYRIARCKQAKPENAPILFEYGAFGRLKPDEDVDKLFRNSRATVSLGYIGLYEVNTTFYGPNWEHNPKAHAFAELITKRMHDLCAKWEDEEGYHYSLYSTPQHLGAFTE